MSESGNIRIVSLVPSLTHSFCEMGFADKIVGITQFCVEPAALAKCCTVVGGTKDPDLKKIQDLQPSHVIANFEENRSQDIESLKAAGLVVLETKIECFDDFIETFVSFERHFNLVLEDEKVKVKDFLTRVKRKSIKRALYLIWKNPYMAVGPRTLISDSIQAMGYKNPIEASSNRYPELTMEEIIGLDPSVIFFSSEPYPFRKRDLIAFKEKWCLETDKNFPEFYRIDGRYTSWYLHYSLKFMDLVKRNEFGEFLTPFTHD